jgi:hypothetical protein
VAASNALTERGASRAYDLQVSRGRAQAASFYRDLAARVRPDQVIVVENEDPEVELRTAIVSHIFAKRADQGRAGFFPARPISPSG